MLAFPSDICVQTQGMIYSGHALQVKMSPDRDTEHMKAD